MSDNTHTDNYTHAIATRRGNILCSSKMERKVVCWMSMGTARISQTSTSLVIQTFSVPQCRSLSVCGTQREGSILKAIDAAERKGSGVTADPIPPKIRSGPDRIC